MQNLRTGELSKVLGISSALAQTNKQRYSNWEEQKAHPCAFAFDGPAYKGLNAATLSPTEINYLQTHLRIIDPLHGILRPLDQIKQYRLEMNTKGLKVLNNVKGGMAGFWSREMTMRMIEDLDQQSGSSTPGRFILDLASLEYSKALDRELLAEHGISVFQMAIEGSTYDAKYGRGSAARF